MTNADILNSSIKHFDDSIRNFLSRDGWVSLSTAEDLSQIYKFNCFHYTDNQSINDTINQRLTDFSKAYIAGEDGDFEQYKAKLKSYDFSATCGLVWTTNYFAYRCRTCCLSPSMSLCGACFNNGNHTGHDFNKFKSQAGGACDCGNSYVMKEFGYCRHHGPSKLSQQRDPPENLIMRLQLLLPIYLECVLFGCWALIQNIDMDDSSSNISGSGLNTSDVLLPVLVFINELLSCGWVCQKIIANIMIDKSLFKKFINECRDTDPFYVYDSAMKSDPQFKFPEGKINSQQLHHECLVDAFMFVCVKLRFPENLITFLIGLLTMESYKDIFVHSYLNHYSRMASTILIHAKNVRNGQDASYNMNNRIVHISVQLFSGEVLALKMVKERDLHYLIVHCLLNMFNTALTRLDSNENYVINCEAPMIQNNVFWPLISDLTNLVTHKSVVDHFLSDLQFMRDWTKLLKLMQFMNFFVLKEGNHIEYETMAFFHAYTMEIEISANSMWNLWYHYRGKDDKESALTLVQIFVTALAESMESLGHFQTILPPHQSRKPLSFHLPLMRNVACFISLGLVYHHLPLSRLLENINMSQMIRWFEETCNTLLGCQEVLIGYWVRNGQSVKTSTTYYIHSQFCYALIDLDIIAAQICASIIPSSTVIYILTNPSQLLKGVKFLLECKNHCDSQSDTSIKKNVKGFDRVGIEKQPLAVEAWLMNLCWILDLRNEMSLDDVEKLRKEVCCELCPEPIKRSDLSHRLPERTGINIQISPDVDAILTKVANYTAPTYDEYSGNLQSGLYTFKPELWDTDYDPIFQSLRSVSKRDAADALAKYREYYRVKQNIVHSNSLWPPYRKPAPHPQLARMENILHCKDMSYILFCCLNMFVNNDYLITEDSLALAIHLIHRSLLISEPQEELDEDFRFHRTRFPSNQYKVDNAWSNLRYKVELSCEIKKKPVSNFMTVENESLQMETEAADDNCEYHVIQRESIISLLLKVHSKLHTTRLHTGGKSLLSVKSSKLQKINPISAEQADEPMEIDEQIDMRITINDGKISSYNNSGNRQGYLLDLKAFEFFNTYPLVYEYYADNLEKAAETGVGINWGDGVDFVGHLLDLIIAKDDDNSKALLELIQNIQENTMDKTVLFAVDQTDHITTESPTTKVHENKGEGNTSLLDTVQDKKLKALDRRRRVIANMAQKQKAFANAHELDFVTKEISHKEDKEMYECVICQLKSNPNIEKMVLLGIICSSGLLKYMQNQNKSANSDKMIVYRKSFIDRLSFVCSVFTHGMIIQTCGHVVHQDCFDKYKAQRPAVTRMRRTITCPLCRRDVHHLTPIHIHELVNSPTDSFYNSLKSILFQANQIPKNSMQLNIIEESIAKNQAKILNSEHQACSLLRSQLELELIICLSHPDQYNAVIRRCIWPEFISYLRTLNGNIRIVIKQADFLFGFSFWNELFYEEDENINYDFLFDSPVDVFLNFIPYIWPHEDYFYIILKACLSMSYIKAIISLSTTLEKSEFDFWNKSIPPNGSFNHHLSTVMNKVKRICNQISTDSTEELYSAHIRTVDSIVVDMLQFILPLLRIASVIKLRLMKTAQIPSDFPIAVANFYENNDYYKEFENLCHYLNLPLIIDADKSPLERIVNLINNCHLMTNYRDIDHFVDVSISEAFIELYLKERNSLNLLNEPSLNILNIGNELFPPKLKDLPNSYDDLFNAYHSEKCANTLKTPPHNFPENGLCLICGKLICLICESMPTAFNEHTKSCCYGIGLIIDVNTSIIHVLLNNEISQWGSVYLDFYGEEDLELKRGRPLFINTRRFKLLEQQWLSHSFKHVIKSWRRVS